VQSADRPLLFLVWDGKDKSEFLGHDERHLFVADIPETDRLGTVRQARPAVPVLIALLDRRVAAWALEAIDPTAREAIPALLTALEDADGTVRRFPSAALPQIDPQTDGKVA
jgi:hypothetical protein